MKLRNKPELIEAIKKITEENIKKGIWKSFPLKTDYRKWTRDTMMQFIRLYNNDLI